MQEILHCVWPLRMQYLEAEKGNQGEKKKKKSRQAHRGSHQRTGCPN